MTFYESINNSVEKIKIVERKSIGWFVTYTPLEIVDAAGLMPYRILGTSESILEANALLQGNICPYVLSILDNGLKGRYDFLDGIVMANYCDAMLRLYDSWMYYLNPKFVYMVDLPKIQNSGARQFFYKEILKFKKKMESHFQIKITNRKLIESIILYNETRSLLKQIYSLRKKSNPPITGTQVFEIINNVMTTRDKRTFNQELQSLINDLKVQKKKTDVSLPRILLSGSFISDSRYFNLIEGLGAIIVCDNLCMGMKYFDMEIKLDVGDPIKALSQGYFEKMPSSLVMDADKKIQDLIKLASEYRVDGIIYQVQKFCNPHLIDFPYFKKRLDKASIPVLFLERENTFENIGQLKTRIQTFLELLV